MLEAAETEASDKKKSENSKRKVKVKMKGSKEKRDVAVQGMIKIPRYTNSGTNDSSIVSKRSVERTGYQIRSGQGQWLRHFVKKPTRRSPLINLGYFLRMKAMEHVIDEVLL